MHLRIFITFLFLCLITACNDNKNGGGLDGLFGGLTGGKKSDATGSPIADEQHGSASCEAKWVETTKTFHTGDRFRWAQKDEEGRDHSSIEEVLRSDLNGVEFRFGWDSSDNIFEVTRLKFISDCEKHLPVPQEKIVAQATETVEVPAGTFTTARVKILEARTETMERYRTENRITLRGRVLVVKEVVDTTYQQGGKLEVKQSTKVMTEYRPVN